MERIEYRDVIDKREWGEGPWQDEPDKLQWMDPVTRYPCLIVRGPVGSLCGYVGVPPGHPWYGKDYDDVGADVHGGLTFAGSCQKADGKRLLEAKSICHKVAEGEPDDVWWLGFDCAHLGDFSPSMRPYATYPRSETYRDVDFVEAECLSLAKQAEKAACDRP